MSAGKIPDASVQKTLEGIIAVLGEIRDRLPATIVSKPPDTAKSTINH